MDSSIQSSFATVTPNGSLKAIVMYLSLQIFIKHRFFVSENVRFMLVHLNKNRSNVCTTTPVFVEENSIDENSDQKEISESVYSREAPTRLLAV